MPDFLQQLATLAGVAVGVLASFVVSYANERSRWRRDLRLRQDERRSAAYAQYAQATKATFQWTMRLAYSRGLPAFGPLLPPGEVETELSRAGHDRATKWEDVLLVGSVEAIAAARRWHESIWRLQDFAHGGGDEAAGWDDAIRATDDARSNFYRTVRQDLGISPAEIPSSNRIVFRPPPGAVSGDRPG